MSYATKRQFADLDYMQSLPTPEKSWLKKFIIGFYAPRTILLLEICNQNQSSNKKTGENMKREAIENNNSVRRDIANRGRKVYEPIKEGFYKCLECLKNPCECEKAVYQSGYHTDDYQPALSSESSVIDLVDAAAEVKKGVKFTSYGDENASLSVGDRVEIALHTHVFSGRCATIVGESHGRWLVVVDGRDTQMILRNRDLKKVEV
jgi:hypothetical protein